jgi:hypothetical protein
MVRLETSRKHGWKTHNTIPSLEKTVPYVKVAFLPPAYGLHSNRDLQALICMSHNAPRQLVQQWCSSFNLGVGQGQCWCAMAWKVWGSNLWRQDISSPYPFRPALGPTQPPVQWVLWFLPLGQSSWGVELTTHTHLAPKLKWAELYHYSPLYPHGMLFADFNLSTLWVLEEIHLE